MADNKGVQGGETSPGKAPKPRCTCCCSLNQFLRTPVAWTAREGPSHDRSCSISQERKSQLYLSTPEFLKSAQAHKMGPSVFGCLSPTPPLASAACTFSSVFPI